MKSQKFLKVSALISIIIVAILFMVGSLTVNAAPSALILATTTSTQDSGLLDALIPIFEEESGHFVKTIAVGSGQAMGIIGRFGVDRFGSPLLFPDAGRKPESLGL